MDSVDDMGKTPLRIAIGKSDVKSVRVLLQYKPRLNFADALSWRGSRSSVIEDELTIAKMHILHGVMADFKGDWKCLDRWWDLLINTKSSEENIKGCADLLKLMITENAVKIPMDQPCVLTMAVKFSMEYRSPTSIMDSPNIWVIPYFYELGFRILEIDDLVDTVMLHSKFCANTLKIIEELKLLRLPCLKTLARKCIRREIGAPLSSKIASLPIPELLRDYIKMSDIMRES